MMASGAGNPKNRLLLKGFSTILIITACILLAASQLGADAVFKSAGEIKMSKIKKYPAPLILVNVPLKIMDVPESWRNAELVVKTIVAFYTGDKSNVEGYGIGQITKPQALENGSFQGVVYVSIYEGTGNVTGNYDTISVAVARRENECMILGYGCNIEGKGCPGNMSGIADNVMQCSDPIYPFPTGVSD